MKAGTTITWVHCTMQNSHSIRDLQIKLISRTFKYLTIWVKRYSYEVYDRRYVVKIISEGQLHLKHSTCKTVHVCTVRYVL